MTTPKPTATALEERLRAALRQLVAMADNPCICGGDLQHRCQASSQTMKRYLREVGLDAALGKEE
jgi:hypothetical protein